MPAPAQAVWVPADLDQPVTQLDADLDQPVTQLDADLDRLATLGPLVGIRPMIQDIGDPHWLARTAVQRGLARLAERNLAFDLLCREGQLPAITSPLARHESLTVAVDHLAKPRYDVITTEWLTGMRALAALPRSYCKLSGMVTEAAGPAGPGTFRAHVDAVLDMFGPARCMYGSDWPACRSAAEPGEVRQLAEDLTAPLAPGEQDFIWGQTAVDCYQLERRNR